MNPVLIRSPSALPCTVLHRCVQFSCLPRRPSWNSTSKPVVTNPILSIMESCNSMSQLKQIQAHMTRTGLMSHRFPASRVLAFCALSDLGSMDHAYLIFTQIVDPNMFIWNTMIRGYAMAKCPQSGLCFFRWMLQEHIEFDCRTLVFVVKICELLFSVSTGENVHCFIIKAGFISDLLVCNTLMHLYIKYELLSPARLLFDEKSQSDVVSWTIMIDGRAQMNLPSEALNLFRLMISRSIKINDVTLIAALSACSRSGTCTWGMSIHGYILRDGNCHSLNLLNTLLDMYVKCDRLDCALKIFERMDIKDVFTWTTLANGCSKLGNLTLARKLFENMPERNVVSWNTMISGYSQTNHPQDALDLFRDMRAARIAPTDDTLVSVLAACSQMGLLDLGRWIYCYYIESNKVPLGVTLGNTFIDMYAKCGSIDSASRIFYNMPARDLVSWNCMICAYAGHGFVDDAFILFGQMKAEGYVPDEITFIGVLTACSRGALVHLGCQHFRSMNVVYYIEPKVEHYACMIDLLGRVGLLGVAYRLISEMPMEPDEAGWGALLNACLIYGNVELGRLAGNKLLQLDPLDSGIYSLLSNIYATSNKWDDVKMVRRMMRTKGVKKIPGCSFILVDGKCHEFLVADESHPLSREVYFMLAIIYSHLEQECHVPNIFLHTVSRLATV